MQVCRTLAGYSLGRADIVRRDKADPASVVYEAIQKAKNENYDVILVDTAGRLQNKFNLMEELSKIKTVAVWKVCVRSIRVPAVFVA